MWEQDVLDKAQSSYSMSVPVIGIPLYLLRKWRRVTPGKITALEPSTRRALELKLKERWSMRLAQMWKPYSDETPEVKRGSLLQIRCTRLTTVLTKCLAGRVPLRARSRRPVR